MALVTLFSPAHADFALNMREGVTATSQSVYDLHMTIFWVCCIIGVVVFGAMIYSIVNHRKSKGAVAAQFHESTTMEILWTVVPIVILVSMAIPATTTLLAMAGAALAACAPAAAPGGAAEEGGAEAPAEQTKVTYLVRTDIGAKMLE